MRREIRDRGDSPMMESGRSRSQNLLPFVVVAYTFSWMFWLPQVLASNNLISPHFLIYICGFIAPFGPFISAFSLTYLKEGKSAVKKLLRRGADCRFERIWFIPTFLLFPLWAGAAFLLGILTGGATINLPWFSNPLSLFFSFGISNFVYMFIFVGVAEEFGWRGYALDRLQARFSATVSSIVLGLVWGLWHLPIFFINGSNQQAAGLGPYLLQIVVFSIWFTWLYNNTNGSVLSVIIFHAMMDLTLLTIFPVTSVFEPNSLPVLSMYVLGVIILIAVLVVYGPQRLMRGTKKTQ
jgi:membrane protease YdiL (CAAX protease family)